MLLCIYMHLMIYLGCSQGTFKPWLGLCQVGAVSSQGRQKGSHSENLS